MSGPPTLPRISFAPSPDGPGDSAHLLGRLFFDQFPQSVTLSNGEIANFQAGHSYDASAPESGDRVNLTIACTGPIPPGDLRNVSQLVENFLNGHGLVAPGFANTLDWKNGSSWGAGGVRSAGGSATVDIDPNVLNQSNLMQGFAYRSLSVALAALWGTSAARGTPPTYHFNWRTGDLRVAFTQLNAATASPRLFDVSLDRPGSEVYEPEISVLLTGSSVTLPQVTERLSVVKRTLIRSGLLDDAGRPLTFHVNPWPDNGVYTLVAVLPSPGKPVEYALAALSNISHVRHQYTAARALAPAFQAYLERRDPPTLVYGDDLGAPACLVASSDYDAFDPPRLRLTSSNPLTLARLHQVLDEAGILFARDTAESLVTWIGDLGQPALISAVAQAFAPLSIAFPTLSGKIGK